MPPTWTIPPFNHYIVIKLAAFGTRAAEDFRGDARRRILFLPVAKLVLPRKYGQLKSGL